jgi:hypothetical protein
MFLITAPDEAAVTKHHCDYLYSDVHVENDAKKMMELLRKERLPALDLKSIETSADGQYVKFAIYDRNTYDLLLQGSPFCLNGARISFSPEPFNTILQRDQNEAPEDLCLEDQAEKEHRARMMHDYPTHVTVEQADFRFHEFLLKYRATGQLNPVRAKLFKAYTDYILLNKTGKLPSATWEVEGRAGMWVQCSADSVISLESTYLVII